MAVKTRTEENICISSYCGNGEHIIIWDFDQIEMYDILKALSKIQDFHGLGSIYIFKSVWGYNALCLDKIFVEEVYNIKYYTRWADYWHTKIGYEQGNWSFKINSDKYFFKILLPTKNHKDRVQSNAHKIFLQKYFDINSFEGKFDNSNDVIIESYKQDVIT